MTFTINIRKRGNPKMYVPFNVINMQETWDNLLLHESLLFLTDTMTVHLECEKMIVGEVMTDMDLVGGDLIRARTDLIVKRRQ